MQKSKVAIFSSSNHPFELEEVVIPDLKKGEILIRNEYTTLCRSDLNTYCGKRQEKTPTILGHEIVGRIVAISNDDSLTDARGEQLQCSDRVSWAIYASDPEDELSKIGIPQKASDLFKYGHERITENSHLHGGLAEFTILRKNTPIVKIDEKLPLPVAAIINCAVATVAGAIRLAGEVQGKNVLVSGAGMLGMIACAMSKTKGAKKLAAMDINPERLEIAQEYGADFGFVPDELEAVKEHFGKSNPFDIIIELSGVKTAIEQTLSTLALGGTAVWVGATHPQPDLSLNAEKMVRNLWTIKGLHNYNQQDFIDAVEFMEHHYQEYPFESMIHDRFTLYQVNEAFEYGMDKNPFRVGIKL